MLQTPVVLIIFRRPEVTRQALACVAAARPTKLFIIADGPRPDHPEDAEACAATRAVVERIEWDCEVFRNYAESNLGCGRRPATGISWVFEHVPAAIILEDDCLPHASFFRFCDELLTRYADDDRIMHIGGSTFTRKEMATPYSYFFSHFQGAWGWATWRRAWQHYDYEMKGWPALRETSFLENVLPETSLTQAWRSFFDLVSVPGNHDIWDHQWTFACWTRNGLSILPRYNLVTNIGFGEAATHTARDEDPFLNVPAREMPFPLVHPPQVLYDRKLEKVFTREVVLPRFASSDPSFRSRLRRMIAGQVPSSVKRFLKRPPAVSRS